MEEEGVIGLARQLGDSQGSAVGEPIALTDYELLEAVPRVEACSCPVGVDGCLWRVSTGALDGDRDAISEDRLGTALEDAAKALRHP
jgi:hypothetical protein